MTASSKTTDSSSPRDSVPDALLRALETAPAMAVAHGLPDAELRRLAETWTQVRKGSASTPVHPAEFDRLGRAAHRLLKLRRAELSARTCPCCGFEDLASPPYLAYEGLPDDGGHTPPYAVHFGDPSGERCPSCGYGFGIDDDPADGTDPITFEDWRHDWYARGCPWFDPEAKRRIWNARTPSSP